MGTLGGNLCLDTRCNYYDQNYEWRKAIDFCMKKDGETCWVATGSPKCLAVSSTDTAPALLALGATRRRSCPPTATRQVAASDLYQNDGIHYLTRRPDEILTAVHVPRRDGWRSAYWKLRRRGSFDFPVLSVAAAAKFADDGTVEDGAHRPRRRRVAADRRDGGGRRARRSAADRRGDRARGGGRRADRRSRWTTPTSI